MDELSATIARVIAEWWAPLGWEYLGDSTRSHFYESADAVLAAIGRTHVLVSLSWIAEKRTEAVGELDKAVFSSFDRGYWDGCENQLCEILTTFGPEADLLARDAEGAG